MAGRKSGRTGEVFAYLNAIGEEEIFEAYLEMGTVEKLIATMGNEEVGKVSKGTFFNWLKEGDRWGRWQDTLKIRAHISAEEAQEEADKATPQNANAQRLKFDGKRWAAKMQDPERFGNRTDVNVTVGTPDQWLQALKDANQRQIKSGEDDIPEADWETEDE